MTSAVQNTSFQHRPNKSAGVRNVNVALMGIALASLILYVIFANGLSSQAWKTSHAQDRLTAVLEQRNGILEQQATLSDRQQLTELASSVGMIPTGAVVYLIQDGAVAAR